MPEHVKHASRPFSITFQTGALPKFDTNEFLMMMQTPPSYVSMKLENTVTVSGSKPRRNKSRSPDRRVSLKIKKS